jgi:hypothetical protein
MYAPPGVEPVFEDLIFGQSRREGNIGDENRTDDIPGGFFQGQACDEAGQSYLILSIRKRLIGRDNERMVDNRC